MAVETKLKTKPTKKKPAVADKSTAADGKALERIAWRRDAEQHDVTSRLGQRVRQCREARGMSLAAASEATGIPGATISRIENNKMAPTFGVVLKIMKGLAITWSELMAQNDLEPEEREASVALPQDEQTMRIHKILYASPHLNSPLLNSLAPIIVESTAKVLGDVGGLLGHKGIEFCYVLSGTLVLHMAGRATQTIPTGGSILFDAEIPHAYLTSTRKPVRLLIVTTRDPTMPQEEATVFGQRGAMRPI